MANPLSTAGNGARPLGVWSDLSLSALVAGLVAAMVGYAGPCAIVFAAAQAAQLGDALLASWLWAISVGSGVCAVVLSLWFRTPVITAWSTPGAALLVSSWAMYSHADAIGAFVVAAAVVTLLGVTGWFAALMNWIPHAVVTAMLAGVLFKFGVDVFSAIHSGPWIAAPMFVAYLVARRLSPRYAVLVTLSVGLAIGAGLGRLAFGSVDLALARPVLEVPTFSWQAVVGLGLPLALVTVASQNAPGIAVLRAANYQTPANPLVTATGLASLLMAPFGAHGINLAATTAAICTGREAHEDPSRRYIAGVACGAFYILVGVFGATVASLLSALPAELVAVVAGVALFGALAGALGTAMQDEKGREPALIAFLVAASGISVLGIGAAFWALVAGTAANAVFNGRGLRSPR